LVYFVMYIEIEAAMTTTKCIFNIVQHVHAVCNSRSSILLYIVVSKFTLNLTSMGITIYDPHLEDLLYMFICSLAYSIL